MVCFHIGVDFFGGGSDATDVEVVLGADIDDDVVVKIDFGIVLATGKPENLFHSDFFTGL